MNFKSIRHRGLCSDVTRQQITKPNEALWCTKLKKLAKNSVFKVKDLNSISEKIKMNVKVSMVSGPSQCEIKTGYCRGPDL